MQQVITITSQGQITIPSAFRQELGLKKQSKVIMKKQAGQLIIEPMPSILDLSGIFADKAIKGKSIDEIIKIEEEAVGEAIAEKYRKK